MNPVCSVLGAFFRGFSVLFLCWFFNGGKERILVSTGNEPRDTLQEVGLFRGS